MIVNKTITAENKISVLSVKSAQSHLGESEEAFRRAQCPSPAWEDEEACPRPTSPEREAPSEDRASARCRAVRKPLGSGRWNNELQCRCTIRAGVGRRNETELTDRNQMIQDFSCYAEEFRFYPESSEKPLKNVK